MKRLIFVFITVLLLISSLTAQGKRSLALINLKAGAGITEGETAILTERLSAELISTGVFAVMERDQIDKVLTEHGLQQALMTTEQGMVEAGKILAVREIMGGTVGKIGDMYTVTVKLIDVQTGQITDTKTDDVLGDISTLLTISMKKIAFAFAKKKISGPITAADSLKLRIEQSGASIVKNVEIFLVEKEGMILIPGGVFKMGADDGEKDEKPVHEVKVKPFWIDKYEVAASDYIERVNTYGYDLKDRSQPRWSDNEHPVVNVTFDEALKFAKAIGKRLPTEAEWEYAARTGSNYQNTWGTGVPSHYENLKGTNKGDKWKKSAPVGSFYPNRFGLYDMGGNVYEICFDHYDKKYYRRSPSENPVNQNGQRFDKENISGFYHVAKGGYFKSKIIGFRLSDRNRYYGYNDETGFRCARDAAPTEIEMYITRIPGYGKLK